MSVPHMLLGLLEPGPSHGYTLKAAFDSRFATDRPLRYGQVYATLSRLQRDGLAEEVAIEPGSGPERRMYAVTPRGVQELSTWLVTPEPPTGYAVSVLFAKTVLALTSGRSAADVLDAQRRVHLARMRAVTKAAASTDVLSRLAADYELAHLEADLQWIEVAGARLTAAGTDLPGTTS